MKVAFATQDLQRVDAHFGWAKNISVYDVGPAGHAFVKVLKFHVDLEETGDEDKLAAKIEAVSDCAILYVAAIGGSAAARVVAKKVHPIKVNKPENILVLLERLERVLRGTPPPWLRKVLIKDQDRTFGFDE